MPVGRQWAYVCSHAKRSDPRENTGFFFFSLLNSNGGHCSEASVRHKNDYCTGIHITMENEVVKIGV